MPPLVKPANLCAEKVAHGLDLILHIFTLLGEKFAGKIV